MADELFDILGPVSDAMGVAGTPLKGIRVWLRRDEVRNLGRSLKRELDALWSDTPERSDIYEQVARLLHDARLSAAFKRVAQGEAAAIAEVRTFLSENLGTESREGSQTAAGVISEVLANYVGRAQTDPQAAIDVALRLRHEQSREDSEALKQQLAQLNQGQRLMLGDLAESAEPRTEGDYRTYMANRLSLLPMHGISPKVGGETVAIPLGDVFLTPYARATSDVTEDALGEVLDLLSYRERKVLELRFGLFGEPVRSHADISRRFNVVEEAIVRTESFALKKLDSLAHAQLLRSVDDNAPTRTILPMREILASGGRTHDLTQLLARHRLVVQGGPGSGKSTLTRYVAWAAASGESMYLAGGMARVPVRLRALEYARLLEARPAATLARALVTLSDPYSTVVADALRAGRAIVLLDGLDEVSTAHGRATVSERVSDFLADPAWDENSVVITSRLVGYQPYGAMTELPHFVLCPLTDAEIEAFLRRWFHVLAASSLEIDAGHEADAILKNFERRPGLRGLANTPLLLTLIALLRLRSGQLPDQRVRLYDAATETLTATWPLTQRGVAFDEALVREWLAPVAFEIHGAPGRDDMAEPQLRAALTASMQEVRAVSESRARSLSEDLLRDVTHHSGLLVPRGTDADSETVFAFLHQTFTEYLAGLHFAHLWQRQEIELKDYAHAAHWREVLLLAAGHLGRLSRDSAGRLINEVAELRSSRWEDYIRRDLFLACRVLADGVAAGPASFVRGLLTELLAVLRDPSGQEMFRECEELIVSLGDSEYRDVLLDLALADDEADSLVTSLADLIGVEGLEPGLTQAVESDDPDTSFEAASLLGVELLATRSRLVRALRDAEPLVRIQAAAALLPGGEEETEAVKTLLEVMASDFRANATYAARVLMAHDPIQAITEADRHDLLDEYGLRSALAQAVGDLSSRAAAGDPSHKQALSTRTLMKAARLSRSAKAFDLAKTLLADGSVEVRLEAALTLSERDSYEGAIEPLKALLSHPMVAARAAGALAQLGNHEAIQWLVREAATKRRAARREALEALVRAGAAEEAVPMLVRTSRSKNTDARLWAARQLADTPGTQTERRLRQLLDDADMGVRAAAAQGLLETESRPEALEVLAVALNHPDREVSSIAERQLRAEADEADGANLIARQAQQEGSGRLAAGLMLARARQTPAVLHAAQALIGQSSARVAAAAAECLLRSQCPDAKRVLEAHIEPMLAGEFDAAAAEERGYFWPDVIDAAVRWVRRELGDAEYQ